MDTIVAMWQALGLPLQLICGGLCCGGLFWSALLAYSMCKVSGKCSQGEP